MFLSLKIITNLWNPQNPQWLSWGNENFWKFWKLKFCFSMLSWWWKWSFGVWIQSQSWDFHENCDLKICIFEIDHQTFCQTWNFFDFHFHFEIRAQWLALLSHFEYRSSPATNDHRCWSNSFQSWFPSKFMMLIS